MRSVLVLACLVLSARPVLAFEASAERIRNDMEALCAHGPRVVGSPAFDAALEHCESELSRAGYGPEREAVTVERWDAGRTPVSLRGPRGSGPVFELTALGRSPALLPGGFELLDLGWGTPDELEEHALSIPGRVVLVQEGWPEDHAPLHRIEKLFLASEAGATAVIFHHPDGAAFRGTVAWPSNARIPAMMLEDASGLIQALGAGIPLELTVQRENAMPPGPVPVRSANLVAEHRGLRELGGPILVSAHLDAWDLGEGALDDAAGVAVVLEAARLIQEMDWSGRRGIRFVIFTGEEFGLQGSMAHLRSCEAAGRAMPAAILNLEMPEAPSGFVVHLGEALPAVLKSLVLARRDLGLQAGVAEELALYSDHLPFLLEGIPSLSLSYHRGEDADRRAHTAADLATAVDPGALARCAQLVAEALWALSDPLAPLPERSGEEALRAHFATHGRDLDRVRTRGY